MRLHRQLTSRALVHTFDLVNGTECAHLKEGVSQWKNLYGHLAALHASDCRRGYLRLRGAHRAGSLAACQHRTQRAPWPPLFLHAIIIIMALHLCGRRREAEACRDRNVTHETLVKVWCLYVSSTDRYLERRGEERRGEENPAARDARLRAYRAGAHAWACVQHAARHVPRRRTNKPASRKASASSKASASRIASA